ncbi:MAG: DUF2127 domain-containing protein [Pseudonocardiaceae bacterium]
MTEKMFRVAIAIKGLDGGLQLIAGLVLIFVPSAVIIQLAHVVITRDLVGVPSGRLAEHLQGAANNFAKGSTRVFAIAYLLLHGVIKLGLVVALWRKVVPVYPVAVVVLAAFVVYELVRAVHTHSIALPLFAALDVVIIVLVVEEYLQLRRDRQHTTSRGPNDPAGG